MFFIPNKGRSSSWFPSPCGEKVGINISWVLFIPDEGRFVVSVPLRGKGRDQLILEQGWNRIGKPRFPSPCGEKVGINLPVKLEQLVSGISPLFPSPCGEKVGINSG